MNISNPVGVLDVWIVNPYGWFPGEGWRDYRSAPLSEALAARGHRVRWWISDIEHRSRKRRTVDVGSLPLPAGVTVEMIPSRSYTRNISLARIRYERSFASGFAERSKRLPPPDLIVLGEPALFFAGPVLAYARRHGVPIVVDGIDLWPEMFHLALPHAMRRLGRMLFAPLYRRRDHLIAQAAAVVAVTGDYLQRLTMRVTPPLSDTIYLGVERSAFRPPRFDVANSVSVEAVYAGNLGAAYDMPVLLGAIEHLATARRPIRFTLAGAGPWEPQVVALAARFPDHVRFLGRIAPEQLPDIYVDAQIGIATYSAGSTVSMPTKLFDYLAAGLATIGSMGGEAEALLQQGAGRSYQAGSITDLIAAFTSYIDDPERLAADRRFAYGQAPRYDLSVQYERYAQLIEQVGLKPAQAA